MAAPDYLRYANAGATRNLPLNPRLVSALAFLPDLGVQAEVFSGGQPGKGSGGKRVGSVRHDHGNAADVRFYREGRMLDWADPGDRPVFQEIVKRSKENGLTGFGAGVGYMAPGTMHIGYGTPGVWGAGGKGANAPDWLREAYGLAPLGESVASSTNDSDFGSASMAGYGNKPGGLGGLGGMPEEPAPEGVAGFLGSAGFGDWLSAMSASLMSSPRNNPFEGFGDNLTQRQLTRQRQEAIEVERADKANDRAALQSLLVSRGFSPEEAQSYSANANVANAAIAGLATDEAKAEKNQTKQWLRDNHPDLADLPVDEALKIAYQRKANGPKTSLTPVYGTDEQGNAVLLQPRDDGTLVRTQMPEGVTISTGTEQIDAGTHWVVKDKRSGEVVGTIPKDNRGEARDTAAGTVEGKTEAERAASASADATNAQNALDLIDKIRNHPYIDRGTGFGSYGNVIRGTGGFDFENLVEQAKSGAFLQAIPQLKGLGALSNTEGQAATAAITRMNTSTSKEAFLEALDDYEKIVRQGLMKAQSNAAKGAAVPAPSAEPAPQPSSYRDKYGLD